jgi:ATP-dependent DNA ligase
MLIRGQINKRQYAACNWFEKLYERYLKTIPNASRALGQAQASATIGGTIQTHPTGRGRDGRQRGNMPSKLPLPQWIPPQLTQLVETAPSGQQWLHEVKLDGFRMAVRIERGRAKLLTRTGLDWTDKYPIMQTPLAAVRAKAAYLDGELCGVGADGLPSFPRPSRQVAQIVQ